MILDLPSSKKPYQVSFGLTSMSEAKDNPFNPNVQVYEGDEYWEGEIEWRNLTLTQARELRVFVHRLRGPSGQFWFKDIRHVNQSAWAGSPVVDGSNQDGIELAVRGLTAGQILPAGDRFQVGDFLYELMEDGLVDGTGRVVLSILPELRLIPANGQALNLNNRVKCMLPPGQKIPETTSRKALLGSYKLKFRESLRQ
ncbi:hypothetical protein [Bowmanella dokdonensis]|uniref:Uncharacterized protein n=1 Tax=Bowmanella dokdonensis TaxID=751969 RepID=A0A939DLP8_9ALTE|nr:hypothetical protein [Bowmanella dokdonensis]MBN7824783.1 hypothetical protein [Bowmanella dokdonensis]